MQADIIHNAGCKTGMEGDADLSIACILVESCTVVREYLFAKAHTNACLIKKREATAQIQTEICSVEECGGVALMLDIDIFERE